MKIVSSLKTNLRLNIISYQLKAISKDNQKHLNHIYKIGQYLEIHLWYQEFENHKTNLLRLLISEGKSMDKEKCQCFIIV